MRKIALLIATAVAALALSVSPAWATESTHVTSPNDTYVDDQNPTTNYGQAGTLDVQEDGATGVDGTTKRAWLKFTTASMGVPGGATLTGAHVKVFLDSTTIASGINFIILHAAPCSSGGNSWDEDTLTWNNQLTVGAQLAGRDIYNASGVLRPSVTFDLSGAELSNVNVSSPTCFVIDRPTDDDSSNNGVVKLESSENGDNAKRPDMWVDYTV